MGKGKGGTGMEEHGRGGEVMLVISDRLREDVEGGG